MKEQLTMCFGLVVKLIHKINSSVKFKFVEQQIQFIHTSYHTLREKERFIYKTNSSTPIMVCCRV